MEVRNEFKVTAEFLRENPNYIFVFGDNAGRTGYGGAAALRDEANTYGFITKKDLREKEPDFTPQDYIPVFMKEVHLLMTEVYRNPNKIYLVSKLGAGLANKYGIWEQIIEPSLPKLLEDLDNVILLWGEEAETYPSRLQEKESL